MARVSYVFNAFKEKLMKGSIRLTDPEVCLNTVANSADTSHAGFGTNAKFRVMLLSTSSSLLDPTTANESSVKAMDVATLSQVSTLGEISTTGYTAYAAGADSILAGMAVTPHAADSASYAKWDATDVTFNNLNSGATIDGILLFWSTGAADGSTGAAPSSSNLAYQYPILLIDLEGSEITTNGGDIEIVWAADGILRLNA
jgi:hypothetical protein